MDSPNNQAAAGNMPALSVAEALAALLKNPLRRIVLRWNAKSALLSAFFRGTIFLAASHGSHHAGRSHAVLAEAFFGAANAGLFGTMIQALRFAEPAWLSELLVAVAFPVLFQVGDICFHHMIGTQVFRAGMISSAVFTALSAMFNLYVMRRGTLLVGAGGNSFAEDLQSLPRLAFLFVASGVRGAWRLLRGPFTQARECRDLDA